jgi:hypothetical protein
MQLPSFRFLVTSIRSYLLLLYFEFFWSLGCQFILFLYATKFEMESLKVNKTWPYTHDRVPSALYLDGRITIFNFQEG